MAARPLKILYVDDEPDIRTIVQLALRMDPAMSVIVAGSGDEALELLGKDGWLPDIALIDRMMPGMNGTELLAVMKARPDTTAIPIVFVTASARQAELDRYIGAGAIAVVSKPFDAVTLARQVRDIYENWAAQQDG